MIEDSAVSAAYDPAMLASLGDVPGCFCSSPVLHACKSFCIFTGGKPALALTALAAEDVIGEEPQCRTCRQSRCRPRLTDSVGLGAHLRAASPEVGRVGIAASRKRGDNGGSQRKLKEQCTCGENPEGRTGCAVVGRRTQNSALKIATSSRGG